MNSVIQAVVIACTLEILATVGLFAYIYERSNHEARFFAAVAESNARMAAAELVLHHRNEVQQQFADERESMKSYVDRTVERAVHKQTK
ncbi:hypothetical protein PMA3_20635 [Pseudomonas silesiensis]|uniref:Uncharacterized protein n=1 Tax=Pseudomonas silesiensis TaxID=1853130 RepID=A0A191YXF5_9PSED|nr:hypothetical protein [Pseudomonas silesiensis]ANJ57434.1 hypothetical protein PMA3_20635 [Pseudomonas silesiensis]